MKSKTLKSQKGQGLIEYALILILVAVIVIAVIIGIWVLIVKVIIAWPAIVSWGSNLVAGLQHGDPTSIFIAVVIAVLILLIIFGRRRR